MKLLFVVLLVLSAWTEAARILAFYPLDGKSHHYIFRPIMEALAKKGHEVVYYTGYPYEATVPPGIVQVDLSKEMIPLQSEYFSLKSVYINIILLKILIINSINYLTKY